MRHHAGSAIARIVMMSAFTVASTIACLDQSHAQSVAESQSTVRVLAKRVSSGLPSTSRQAPTTTQSTRAIPVAAPAAAGEIRVLEQPLEDLIKFMARRNGMQVVMGRGVRGTVRNEMLSTDLNTAMAQLSGIFDFDWYVEGRQIVISRGDASVTRILYLDGTQFSEFRDGIQKSGISSDDLEMTYLQGSQSVVVKGPAALVARAEVIAQGSVRNGGLPTVIRGGQ